MIQTVISFRSKFAHVVQTFLVGKLSLRACSNFPHIQLVNGCLRAMCSFKVGDTF